MKRILVLILIAGAIAAGFYYWKSWQNNRPVPAGAVNLQYPLEDGTFVVIQSGRFGSIHTSEMEKYALDINKSASLKSWFQFRKSGLESDASFGAPVYSPSVGNIKKVVDGFPDMPIGIEGRPEEANRVLIACDGFDVLMVHFKKDSILVKVSDTVATGQKIAEIGNSGKSSGPHLHIAAYNTDETVNLPITFNGRYFWRGMSFTQ